MAMTLMLALLPNWIEMEAKIGRYRRPPSSSLPLGEGAS